MLKKINGVNLFVQSVGRGKPVIVIHGLGSSHEGVKPVVDWLKEDHQVIAYDCRGHGRSDKPENYTLNDHARDVTGILDHFGIDKASLIGMSMGSYIAQAAAILIPDRIDKLLLLVPKAHGKSSSVQRILLENNTGLDQISQYRLMRLMIKYTFAPKTSFLVKLGMLRLRGPGKLTPAQSRAVDRALAGFDLREGLKTLPVETLVCAGKYDGINPPEMGREVAELIPNSKFVLFENSGHLPMIEEREKCREVVRDFLFGTN